MLAMFAPIAMADSPDAQVSSLFVRGVGINVNTCRNAPREEIAFACHRLEKGKGFAILIRAYVPSAEIDTDAYYKTTFLFYEDPPMGQKLKLPNKNIFAFSSAGSSSFPERTGCYGEPVAGEVEILRRPAGVLEIIYNADFRMKSVDGRPGACRSDDLVSRSFDTKEISLKDLTSWLGSKDRANNAWSESHPEPRP